MVSVAGIPDKIRDDLAIYLAPDEKILKAISRDSGKVTGKVWLLLTSNSIFFHTCEHGKEPVVALIERNKIKKIDYFQKSAEIILTFVPSRNPDNTTKLSFPITQKTELEEFCEDLADVIDFRIETEAGIKVYPRSEESKLVTENSVPTESDTRNAGEKLLKKVNTIESNPAAKEKLARIKTINSTSSLLSSAVSKSTKDIKKAALEVKIVTGSGNTAQSEVNGQVENSTALPARYIVVTTLVSLFVAFIWYQFFKFVSSDRQNR